MEYSPKKMKELLEQNQFSFKKNFGQNFIVDENIIRSIIDKADIDKETLVIEIGPGAGSLTYFLAQASKQVVCYEIDRRLQPILSENLRECNNIDIFFEDFLTADIRCQTEKYHYEKLYVVANLPYYITTPIIMKIIEDNIAVDKMILMVQKEVGDRFKALPGTKEYGSLSIFLQYYFHIRKLMDISRNVFLPKPNVDSIIIEFKRREEMLAVVNRELFFRLVRDSFTQKRKTLRNNLQGYDLEIIASVLKHHGYDLNVRAEQLSLAIFIEIANSLSTL